MRLINFLLLLSITALAVSCNKAVDIPGTACIAGTTGKNTLVLKPEHHGDPITGSAAYPDSAWIKFNTSEYPGDNPALYDLIVTGTAGADSVIVTEINCGNYFIYMTGFDTSIAERVRGGIPVTIAIQSGTSTIKIPVTED